MTGATETLLLRNLEEVFGEPDAPRRRAAIADLWTADAVFIDPGGRHVGPAEIDAAVAGLHALFPGFVFTAIGSPQAFHGIGRLAWAHGPAGGPPQLTGQDVVAVRDDRIASLFTFLDVPE